MEWHQIWPNLYAVCVSYFDQGIFLTIADRIRIHNDTFESDCPVQILRKMMRYLKIEYLYSTSFFWSLKKVQKMTSQLVIFRVFVFSSPSPTLNLKINLVNQLIKNYWMECSTCI